MIAIKERIIEVYNNTRPENLLFNDKKWYQRPHIIWLSILILLGILMLFILVFLLKLNYLSSLLIFSIIWSMLLFFVFWAVLNPINKRKAKKELDIEIKKDKLVHWATTEFKEFRLGKFYKELLDNKVLVGRYEDVNLLTSYEELFESESRLAKSSKKFLLGGTILLFILPIWGASTSILLSDKENFIESLRLIFKFIFLILCFVYFLNLLKLFWIEDILNRKSKKYKDIRKILHQLKLNLELENAR